RLRIRTALTEIDPRHALAGQVTLGRYATLAVADDGIGMTPEVRQRAFEPFYTTKGVGRGSGLGLSTIYGFARQSGGVADIESEPGNGTTVLIHLPIPAAVPAET